MRSELVIPTIVLNLKKLKVEQLVHIGHGSNLMDKLDIYIGRSSKFICPPVTVCIFCNKTLQKNNAATQVVCHTVNGPKLFSKLMYRCWGSVDIWGCNLGKPALYLIRGEYSHKSKRSTNVIKLGDLSVLKVETPL